MASKYSPEQKRALDKAAFWFFVKCMWNGIHHGLMAMVMNFILVLGSVIFLHGSQFVNICGLIFIGVFIFKRVTESFAEDFKHLSKTVKSIIKK